MQKKQKAEKTVSYSALDNAKTNSNHYRITLLSVAGTFLDGYDISIIGVALTIITAISAFSYATTPLGKGLMAVIIVKATPFNYIAAVVFMSFYPAFHNGKCE